MKWYVFLKRAAVLLLFAILWATVQSALNALGLPKILPIGLIGTAICGIYFGLKWSHDDYAIPRAIQE